MERVTSEKLAAGYLFDGKVTMVVGTHTHIPTSDHRVMKMEPLIKQTSECAEITILL